MSRSIDRNKRDERGVQRTGNGRTVTAGRRYIDKLRKKRETMERGSVLTVFVKRNCWLPLSLSFSPFFSFFVSSQTPPRSNEPNEMTIPFAGMWIREVSG